MGKIHSEESQQERSAPRRSFPGIDLTINDGEFVVFVGPFGLRQVHAFAPHRRA